MKHTYIFLFSLLALLTAACSNDDLDKESIFADTEQTDSTPLDQWVKKNFTDPYNIRFLYRYNDKEPTTITMSSRPTITNRWRSPFWSSMYGWMPTRSCWGRTS